MQQNLQDLFERALDGEPPPPPGDSAARAMHHGRRIRRRRGLLVGGVTAAAVAATMLGVNLAVSPDAPPPTVSAAAAAAMPRDPACTWPVRDDASDVSIFLADSITDAQRTALHDALRADPAVRDLRFESREEAYQKFAELWQDSPDFLAQVGPAQLPESFRLALADPADFRRLAETFRDRSGVEDLVGRSCRGARK
ncbi:permease-like cell division protein FtsX [Actinoplanes sp. NPDC049599]|uniref:permease-like cell division protein FtsX n=1 Tax=Actinoplanes sp. NPDC049599 TaxID=3363903 RepID=UPI0037A1F35E